MQKYCFVFVVQGLVERFRSTRVLLQAFQFVRIKYKQLARTKIHGIATACTHLFIYNHRHDCQLRAVSAR